MHSASNVGHGIRDVIGSRLSLRLALVLEPDSHRFYFPIVSDNVSRRLSVEYFKTRYNTQS